MVVFYKFFTSVFLAIVYVSLSGALTVPVASKHATHSVRSIGRDVKIEVYHPKSKYNTFGAGIDHPLRKRGASLKESSEVFISSHLGANSRYQSGFAGEVASHAFAHQVINGLIVSNAVSNVAFNADGKVVALGSSFFEPSGKIPSTTLSVSFEDAKNTAEAALDGTYLSEIPSTVEYLAKDNGEVVLVHVLQIRNEEAATWYNALVNAHTNKLESITDYVAHATYRVLPITKQNLLEGFETLVDPANLKASPQGWHSDGSTTTAVTEGNNVVSYKSSTTNTSPATGANLAFEYIQNPTVSPTTATNINAALVNAFYILNAVHDIAYRYGFTEAAFNFHNNNFRKGGRGNDRVLASMQDDFDDNNALFSTPPDGQSGRMRAYFFTFTDPNRDSAFGNDLVVHEMAHGISGRLTGGGTAGCLQTTEAGGMGEGWSDALASWTEKTSAEVPDYVLGQYLMNTPNGFRTRPYSTSSTVNPLTYGSVRNMNKISVKCDWANLLHNVYAALVAEHGWSATSHTDPNQSEGNVVFLHLFLDAMALQPCNPTFLNARDAWLQADVNRYDGANRCLLWRVFASKGLGVNAANYIDNNVIPSDC
ncbi:extracellular metallo proteinase mep [Favolaschia claudopus]|uniref:Extracellular metalloproteinase n=1 Tax=Favolaschia claudopus TaxID=2862362 RepID=A0AAV9ZHS0_9AGAR